MWDDGVVVPLQAWDACMPGMPVNSVVTQAFNLLHHSTVHVAGHVANPA